VRIPRSVLVVRLACLAALGISAALVAESMHPERGFCPLQAACEKARHSALGNVMGVPTSVIGIFAFASLFFVTLLPPRAARFLGRPAAWLGAFVAAGLVGYQWLVLGSFCPLCLVADTSAILAGVVAFGWPRVPPGLSGRALEDEHLSARMRWALAAGLVFAAPLLWPRPPEKPGWIEIPNVDVEEPEPEVAEVEIPALPKLEIPTGQWRVPTAQFDAYREPVAPPARIDGDPNATPASAVVDPAAGTPPASAPAPASIAPPPPVAPPAARPAVRPIPVVMYLNPFCAHCRATHASLDTVLASYRTPVRMKHVYVWTSSEIPYWAWACALGGTMGIEDRVFAELLRARNERADEVQAAAMRAGLDPALLASAVGRADLRVRLDRDRQTMLSARIQGLPTLDVGRRRLMGEQSEDELVDALRAARPGR